jgi:hypothetical protein
MSSILTMRPTTPYTSTVIATATTAKMTARETNGSSATSFRAMTMISADRMKSVRMAPLTISSSWLSPSIPTGLSCSPSCPPPIFSQTFSAPS